MKSEEWIKAEISRLQEIQSKGKLEDSTMHIISERIEMLTEVLKDED